MPDPSIRPERIRRIRSGSVRRGPVVYWMSRDQRTDDNWALLYAQQKALSAHHPLRVVFCLVPEFMHAGMRAYAFMLDGLKQVSMRLKEKAIPFALLVGSPQKTLPDFLKRISASLLVADFDPLKTKIRWLESTARRIDIPFDQVDAHNIVPCWTVSPKLEWAAYTFRPKMRRLLPAFLDVFPKLKKHPFTRPNGWGKIDWPAAESSVKPRKPSGRLGDYLSGEKSARLTLDRFMRDKLPRYLEDRNNPAVDGLSGLSPYVHFGQISAQRIALELRSRAEPDANADAFLEQLMVRRELSDNYCFYNGAYDSLDGFPKWAKATLHAQFLDRRPALYSLRALEGGRNPRCSLERRAGRNGRNR